MESTKFMSLSEVVFLKVCSISIDGRNEVIHCEKITKRVRAMCYGLNESYIDVVSVSLLYDTICHI